jgi:predicted GNAT family acetyltransferase
MEVVNNKKEFCFEIALPDGEYARLTYRWLKGNMVLMHTLVPASQRGKGVGAVLVKYVLDYVRAQNLKAIVYCPFVAKYLESHPEYKDIIEEHGRN